MTALKSAQNYGENQSSFWYTLYDWNSRTSYYFEGVRRPWTNIVIVVIAISITTVCTLKWCLAVQLTTTLLTRLLQNTLEIIELFMSEQLLFFCLYKNRAVFFVKLTKYSHTHALAFKRCLILQVQVGSLKRLFDEFNVIWKRYKLHYIKLKTKIRAVV